VSAAKKQGDAGWIKTVKIRRHFFKIGQGVGLLEAAYLPPPQASVGKRRATPDLSVCLRLNTLEPRSKTRVAG